MNITKFVFLSFLCCMISVSLMAQRSFSGQQLISEINKNNWNKEEMLKYYEKHFKVIAQEELGDFNVSSVKINRSTGEVSVIGTNKGGNSETISGLDIKDRIATSGSRGGGNSASVFGWLRCLFRKLTFRSCDTATQAAPTAGETAQDAEIRQRTNLMMYE